MAVNQYIDLKVNKGTNFIRKVNLGARLCLLCNSPLDIFDELLCCACASDLPANQDACPVCAFPDTYKQPCVSCINSTRPYFKIQALYRYEYPVNRLIQYAKYHSRLDIAWFIGQQMAVRFSGNLVLPDCLIPVPMHAVRLAKRGYNQAHEIAASISRSLKISVESGSVRRTIATRAQTELSAKQRKHNVCGAFTMTRSIMPEYRHVAIVDDVVTTGATVTELARALRGSGITRVDVWACARAVP